MLAVICSVRFVSLFTVKCISKAYVTVHCGVLKTGLCHCLLWYAHMRFVSVVISFFQTFLMSVITKCTCPFVWCHWYFTARMVCVHTHVCACTYTHKFACFKQTFDAVGKYHLLQ